MKYLREHITLLRYFWLLMTLHIINLSVDAPDFQSALVPEDLSYNDMESVLEILLEEVLDIEDAIPEHDDDDNKDALVLKNNFQAVYFQEVLRIDFMLSGTFLSEGQGQFYYKNTYFEQFHPEVVPPPPKV